MEAVRGAENYGWSKEFAEQAPEQNTILTYTRNVVGPMDYTPVTFSSYKCCGHTTSNAQELALSVLFETGLLHFADKPSSYLELGKPIKEFMKQVPVTWDDTRFVQGEPGKETVLARKNGNAWYIAAANGEMLEKTLKLKLPFLTAKGYKAKIYKDGANPAEISYEEANITNGQLPAIKVLPKGGFVIVLSPI